MEEVALRRGIKLREGKALFIPREEVREEDSTRS